MPDNMRHQRAAQIAAGGLLPKLGLAQLFHLLMIFDEDRRLHNAGIDLPMDKRTGVKQFNNLVQRFAHCLRQNPETGRTVGNILIIDQHPHHAAVLVGEGFAMAVVDVGAAWDLRLKHQPGAVPHLGKNVSQRPGDAPLSHFWIHD